MSILSLCDRLLSISISSPLIDYKLHIRSVRTFCLIEALSDGNERRFRFVKIGLTNVSMEGVFSL